jgi:hypothetical protein
MLDTHLRAFEAQQLQGVLQLGAQQRVRHTRQPHGAPIVQLPQQLVRM